jgi:hypothetical protein
MFKALAHFQLATETANEKHVEHEHLAQAS